MKLYLALLLILNSTIQNQGRNLNVRPKRDLKGNIIKLAKSTIKSGLSLGGETLKEIQEIAKEKSLYKDYLTAAFLDLILYPTVSHLQKNIKENNEDFISIRKDSKDSNLALIIMSDFFPSFIIIMISLLLTYIPKFRNMKSNLGDIDDKVETILDDKSNIN